MSLQVTVMSLDFESFSGPRTQTFSKPEITFGRLPSNDVVLETPEVSQRHACLRLKRDQSSGQMKIFVTDLGSTNGTMVENSPVVTRTDVEVASNVRIRIGNYLIKPSYVDDGLDEITFEDHLQSKPNGRSSLTNGHAKSVIDGFDPIEKIAAGLSDTDMDDLVEETEESVDTRSTRLFRNDDLEKFSFRKPSAAQAVETPSIEIHAEGGAHYTEPAAVVTTVSEYAAAPELAAVTEIEVDLPAAAIDKAAAAFENQEVPEIEMEPAVESAVAPQVELVRNAAPEFEAIITGKTDVADILDLNFDAVSLYRLTGKILHRGQPLAGVAVNAEGLGSAITGPDGSFNFGDIEDGTPYSLSVTKDRFKFDGGRKGVVANDTSIVIDATKLVTIQGRIIHKGQPLAGVLIDAGPLGKTTTGEDGVYRFADVPENTAYTIKASKAGYKLR
jgi:hypothetical protein